MQLRTLPAAIALLSSIPFSVMAADNSADDSIIVTATRTAQTVDDSLASVTVITHKDIEQLQAQSLRDLLRGEAGLDISNNGGTGKVTSIFMRGTESDHLLVLVDGVKVGSATTGATAFQDIPVAQIERIEIVRGPRSSLYGSEAIGGVIQIFTRKGKGNIKPSFSTTAGSYGTYNTQAGISGSQGNSWFSANVSDLNTTGFNACTGSLSGGCYNIEPDKDGYHNAAGSLRGGYRFSNGTEVELNALHAKGNAQFDGSYTNESKTVQQVLGGHVKLSPTNEWQMTLAAGQSRDDSDNFENSVYSSRFNTTRDNATWQNDIIVGDDRMVTLGVDRLLDHVESDTAYAVTSRGNTGLFTQYQGAVGSVDMQLSLRHDDNEQFGKHNTGGIAFGTDINNKLRATLSYGTAFKAPTFNELYYPYYGSATLQPEKSYSTEVGVTGKTANGKWSINGYETRVTNLIAYDASISLANNLDEAQIRGIEAICSVDVVGWALNANLTLLDPKSSSSATDGKVLPRRAKTSYRLDADRPLGSYSVGASLRAEGDRYEDLSNTQKLGGFATVDLRAGYEIAKAWQLQGRVENLFDKNYETAAYYNQAGRSLYVTLRYQP